jgi:SAM-dependent methyltransferase
VRQFLDIGTGIPTAGNTHEVAQEVAPEARVVYVDNDPIVLMHARALMTSHDAGATAFIEADLREPQKILADPAVAATLDLRRPVALMLVAVLMYFRDGENPRAMVSALVDALPPGSYLAITHPTADFNAEAMAGAVAAAEHGVSHWCRAAARRRRRFSPAWTWTSRGWCRCWPGGRMKDRRQIRMPPTTTPVSAANHSACA